MTAPLGQLFDLGLQDLLAGAVFRDALLERDERQRLEAVLGCLPPMARIPAGTYLQGSPESEPGHQPNERQRLVTISRPFWLGAVPVTQALYEAVTGSNPSHFRGPDRPVEQVSWEDCQVFLAALNELLPGFGWRLPTEAEWEYAARAGTTGSRHGPLDQVAWHWGNASQATHPVAQKAPNPWGLYDMLGNVWEWCQDGADDWSPAPYPEGHAVDPVGGVAPFGCSVVARGPATPGTSVRRSAAPTRPTTATATSASASPAAEDPTRVFRGSSWRGVARHVRAAFRYAYPPDTRDSYLGFRLAGGAP